MQGSGGRLSSLYAEVSELSGEYGLQEKLREGVRGMAYAYSISDGKDKILALSNVKAGFRETTARMVLLEEKIGACFGHFRMEIKGEGGWGWGWSGDRDGACLMR